MKKRAFIAIVFLFFLNGLSFAGELNLPYRWFFASFSLAYDKHVEEIEEIVGTASKHGLNGMVLSTNYMNIAESSGDYLRRLLEVKNICDKYGVEIIPLVFSVGYGWDYLSQNKNLAAGIPVKDALFVVKNGKARPVSDKTVKIKNGGFERFNSWHKATHFHIQDKPRKISFIDYMNFREGEYSLRLQNFEKSKHGHGRIMQKVSVKPYKRYKVSLWVKSEALKPEGAFQLYAITPDERYFASPSLNIPSTMKWKKVSFEFPSLNYDEIEIYAGVWDGEKGKVWIDGMRIEETDMANILRRPGTPLVVKSEKSGAIYEEGKDFAPLVDKNISFKSDHESPVIEVLPGSRIKEGEKLRVSYYFGMEVSKDQVSLCMSEPMLFDIWKKEAQFIQKQLSPKKYFLDIDEIRAGGSCHACKSRNLTMAEILGDTVTKQFRIIKDSDPEVTLFIWSDMFDPYHNAISNFYLADGDYSESWKHIPKDLIIVDWNDEKMGKSLNHFSKHGFKTVAAAYYDKGDLKNPRAWLKELASTEGAVGIMYTTWKNQYKLLAPFGDIVGKR